MCVCECDSVYIMFDFCFDFCTVTNCPAPIMCFVKSAGSLLRICALEMIVVIITKLTRIFGILLACLFLLYINHNQCLIGHCKYQRSEHLHIQVNEVISKEAVRNSWDILYTIVSCRHHQNHPNRVIRSK